MSKGITFFAILLLSILNGVSNAQILEPAKWKVQLSVNDAAVGDEIDVVFKANIDDTWYLYSNDFDPELGPILISFNFDENNTYERVGDVKPINAKKKYDEVWEGEVSYFEKSAELRQTILIKELPLKVSGTFDFQSCSNETGMCVMGDDKFDLSLKGKATTKKQNDNTSAVKVEAEQREDETAQKQSDSADKKDVEIKNGNETEPIETQSTTEKSERSYWMIFFLSFLGGFAALLTPCVFPMIPMTVSFFTKQSTSKAKGIRNAIQYGIFIVLIYVVLGWVVVLLFGADALNALSTNHWFNLFFFLLLVVFAISFLGAFEIVLPASWVNKADSGADKGGLIGSFFMALTLALVSFSCTGPIVGALLVTAASEGGIAPLIGMFGFSLALALPFALFAAFPGYLNSLPKSGGWLNSVKVVLGFLELALAFKFLSNADLVLDLGLLEREVFIAIWIAVFGALGFYLFGKLKLPHDSPMDHLPVSRLLLGLLVFSFTIYMIPGLWGAPLKLISAFPPPMEYAESPEGVGNRARKAISVSSTALSDEQRILEEKRHVGPQGLMVFHEYDDALAYAKLVNKPLFIDFTGKACVNCRQMEINVWSDPAVNSLMLNDFVVVALYVDFKKNLPKEEHYTSETTGKKITTIGGKWSDFQISRYNINSQPYYAIVDHSEENLVEPRGYEPNKKAYAEWLQKAKENFHKK
ncbi:Thiol:disulfide interchange protein DsbD [Saccharicrinis carchari]|uniref:Thiol:disulfide interchange protein DsbD n=1 Tax=Saccharicrinis carchari TaxID=1168039 RepID=A0A521CP86_SACCC|nr:thioredoxin family protein [Saccharicrinis carchari]SMO61267.1 Thiol:disulfide interchange protein DsbD [Saccharicrinis carchari]